MIVLCGLFPRAPLRESTGTALVLRRNARICDKYMFHPTAHSVHRRWGHGVWERGKREADGQGLRTGRYLIG